MGPTVAAYSFCPYGTGDLKNGSPVTVTITDGIAVLSVAQTGNIGVGDRLTYDTDSFCFIKTVNSNTSFDVITPTGGTPNNITGSTVVSIAHEYASLSAAIAGSSDANHLNTSDLVTNNFILKWPSYRDHYDDTPDSTQWTLSGYTTSDDCYIKWYTPQGGSDSIYNQRHPGYVKSSPDYYHCRYTNTGQSGVVNSIHKFVIDGIELQNNQTSANWIDIIKVQGSFSSGLFQIKNSIISTSTSSTTPKTTGVVGLSWTGTPSLTMSFEQCIFNSLSGGGIAVWDASGIALTVNINSCSIYKNGFGSPARGAVYAYKNNDAGTVAVSIFNSILLDNDTTDLVISGTYSNEIAFDIHDSIDSDGSIAAKDASASGCLASRTATDSTSPGAGDWVAFRDITSLPYDLRLLRIDENDAWEMHSNSSGAGLTIPSTDIAGTSRPQNTNYDCGAFELVQASGTEIAVTGTAAISSAPATAGSVTANQVIPQTLSGTASISTSPATSGAVVAETVIAQALTGSAAICSADATAGTAIANTVIPQTLAGTASISASPSTVGTVTVEQVIPQALSGTASISTSDATAGIVTTGTVISQVSSGAQATSSADATAGAVTANQVIPQELAGAASISSADAAPGTVITGSVIPQTLSGAASISSSEAVAGAVTANKSLALSGSASVSGSPSTAGAVTVNQIIAQTLAGAASLSGGTSTPGTVITGSVIPQTLDGAASASTSPTTVGTVTAEQIISQALSGTLSVSESPATTGSAVVGLILSGASSISDAFATPGTENHEGVGAPQILTGTASISDADASSGIAYWGKRIGEYSASRALVISEKYRAQIQSEKYKAIRRT